MSDARKSGNPMDDARKSDSRMNGSAKRRATPRDLGRWARSIALRSLVLGLVWFAVTEADPSVAVYGLAAVPAAVAVSLLITGGPAARGPRPRQLVAAGGLAWWIARRSVAGGLDVARRAVRLPRADIDPYWTTHESSLQSEGARVAFVLILNLMPGTLTARLDGTSIDLHVISRNLDVDESTVELERRITAILG